MSPNNPNQMQGCTKSDPKSYFHISHQIKPYSYSKVIWGLYLFYKDLSMREVWGNWVLNTFRSCVRTHGDLTKDFSSTFHINCGITLVPRPSYEKVIWGVSYTCLTDILALCRFGETRPKCFQILCRVTP